MKSFQQVFLKYCNEVYKPLGFIRKKQVFLRFRGDTIQYFSLKKSYRIPRYDITFGIAPLCFACPVYPESGQYELTELEPGNSGWMPDLTDEAEMLKCAQSMVQSMEQHMIPLLEASVDCGSALQNLNNLEVLLKQKRQEDLKLAGLEDCAASQPPTSVLDGFRFYMALKAQDWKFAVRYLAYQTDSLGTRLQKYERFGETGVDECYYEEIKAHFLLYCEYLTEANARNGEYFAAVLRENETAMLDYLAEQYSIVP